MKFIQSQSRPIETPKSYINGSVGSNNKVINIDVNNKGDKNKKGIFGCC